MKFRRIKKAWWRIGCGVGVLKDNFDILFKLLVMAALLVVLGLLADLRRGVVAYGARSDKQFESIRLDLTRFIMTGECGQAVDNKIQLGGVPMK